MRARFTAPVPAFPPSNDPDGNREFIRQAIEENFPGSDYGSSGDELVYIVQSGGSDLGVVRVERSGPLVQEVSYRVGDGPEVKRTLPNTARTTKVCAFVDDMLTTFQHACIS